MRRRAGDRGAGTLLVLASGGLLLALGCAWAVATALVVAHRAAQAAADLAALAGARGVARGDDACADATRVAADNDARLVRCTVDGRVVDVTVQVEGPHWRGGSWRLQGRARAGPQRLGGAPSSSTSRSATAPGLSRGLFWLPHLGDCTHDGHPSGHPQSRMVSRVAVSQSRAAAKPRAVMPAPPGCPS